MSASFGSKNRSARARPVSVTGHSSRSILHLSSSLFWPALLNSRSSVFHVSYITCCSGYLLIGSLVRDIPRSQSFLVLLSMMISFCSMHETPSRLISKVSVFRPGCVRIFRFRLSPTRLVTFFHLGYL